MVNIPELSEEVRARLAHKLAVEMRAQGLNVNRLAKKAGMGYESTRRVVNGDALEIDLYEKVAQTLGLRLALEEHDAPAEA